MLSGVTACIHCPHTMQLVGEKNVRGNAGRVSRELNMATVLHCKSCVNQINRLDLLENNDCIKIL